jgi:hypothetical protein
MTKQMAEVFGDELNAEDLEAFEMIAELYANVTFLSEPWVTYYVLNEDGYPIQEDSSLQMIFDLNEWGRALAAIDPEEFDDAELPDLVITLDMEYSIQYENINSAVRVSLPELTPENSIDIFEMFGPTAVGLLM